MTLARLRRRLRALAMRRLAVVVDATAPVGSLDAAEHATVYALFQAICDDAAFPAGELSSYVARQTRAAPGALDAYRSSVALLDDTARARFGGTPFGALSIAERDAVLRALFRPYPHPEREPSWRRRARLSSHRVDRLVSTGARRKLRHYVMRELLAWYYTTERGWAVVGWTDFPGRAAEWWNAPK